MRICEELRVLWIEDLAGEGGARAGADHLADCADCAAWFERQRRVARALGELARRPAPAVLRERCGAVLGAVRREELAGGFLGTLDRVPAPAELERRLRHDMAAQRAREDERLHRASDRPLIAGALEGLARREAPAVLGRLVREELADPAAARARRFAGDLQRRGTPLELQRRVQIGILSGGRTRGLLRVFLPVALAAGLLIVAALRWGRTDQRPARHLAVVELSSLAELGPMARGLLASLGGSMLVAEAPGPGESF